MVHLDDFNAAFAHLCHKEQTITLCSLPASE
jgi:hypothetical protein